MMRFWGGGVGHKSTWNATDFFKNDHDTLDLEVLTPVSNMELEEEEIEEPVMVATSWEMGWMRKTLERMKMEELTRIW